MYHQITHSKTKDIFSVSIDNFKSHILYLKNIYNVSSIENLMSNSNNFSITFDDGYEDIYKLIFPFIKIYKINITIFLTLNTLNKSKYLKDYQILEMINSGYVEIGCHGNTHKSLKLLSDSELFNEITAPKNILESRFNIKISYLSFPNGIFDENTLDHCKKLHFKKTFNSNLKTIDIKKNSNDFVFPRICMYNIDNLLILKNKIKGKFNFLNINPNE